MGHILPQPDFRPSAAMVGNSDGWLCFAQKLMFIDALDPAHLGDQSMVPPIILFTVSQNAH
jgi:hypothetical protein